MKLPGFIKRCFALRTERRDLEVGKSELEMLARKEASVWTTSPYYEHAERILRENVTGSGFWGGNSLFRPLFEQLDLTVVIELACGHGRHSAHILEHYASAISKIICMDVNDSNIEFCTERFREYKNVEVIKNNGIDFHPVGDNSVSSIFCYDSMVHFHRDVVKSYLNDTYRVLKPGGRALYHHSNYSENPNTSFAQNTGARAYMTKELFTRLSGQTGLGVLHQEVIDWGGAKDLDCITLLEKRSE